MDEEPPTLQDYETPKRPASGWAWWLSARLLMSLVLIGAGVGLSVLTVTTLASADPNAPRDTIILGAIILLLGIWIGIVGVRGFLRDIRNLIRSG